MQFHHETAPPPDLLSHSTSSQVRGGGGCARRLQPRFPFHMRLHVSPSRSLVVWGGKEHNHTLAIHQVLVKDSAGVARVAYLKGHPGIRTQPPGVACRYLTLAIKHSFQEVGRLAFSASTILTKIR